MNSKEPEMMRMRWRADRAVSCLGALLGLLASSASLGECGYEITAIIFGPDCGYELANIAPRDLNDEGHIAGHYSCPAGLESTFFWTPETGLIKIGFPPGSNGGRGYGINDSDVVVGYMNTSGWDRYAFRWEAGSLSLLPPWRRWQILPGQWGRQQRPSGRLPRLRGTLGLHLGR